MTFDRRKFLGGMAVLASAGGCVGMASSSPAHAAQNQSPKHITVGVGGDVASIADALGLVVGPSSSNQYVIQLLPGVHVIQGVTIIPAYVSLIGVSRESCVIECVSNWSYLGFSSNQYMNNFSIRATRTSATATNGIMQNNGKVRDFYVEDITLYLKGGYGAAIYCNYFSTLHFRGVIIWTTSIGIRATGYVYLTDCHVHLSGNATGTPYYGLTCLTASNASVRYYVLGGFYGVGYATTNEPGFGANGFSIVNDGAQPVIAFYIPSEHQPTTLTGTRFQLTGVECFVRNEGVVSNVACSCVRVDGAGIVRLFGGIYQAETPNYPARAWAVANTNFGTHATYGNVEMYSARVTSVYGTATSYAQDPVGKLTVANDSILLTQYTCSSYFCDASAGPFTVKLPAVWANGGPPQGSKLRFIKTDATNNPVTIRTVDGISTIEGQSSVALASQYEKIQLLYGASGDEKWYLI